MNKLTKLIPVAAIVFGVYLLVTTNPSELTNWKHLANLGGAFLGGGYFLYKQNKETVSDWFSGLFVNRKDKVVEKTEEISQIKDEEAMRYLCCRARKIEDSEQRQIMLTILDELDSELFKVHNDYKPEHDDE